MDNNCSNLTNEEFKKILIDFDEKWKITPLFKKCKYESFNMQIDKINEEDREFNIAKNIYRNFLKNNDKMCDTAKNHFIEELIDSIQARFTLLINNCNRDEITSCFMKHMEKMELRYGKKD